MPRVKVNPLEKYEIKWVEAATDPHFWEKMASEDSYPQMHFNVSDQLLRDYYAASAELLNEKKWNDARDAFLFLTFLNPTYQHFWLGLGIAEQALGEFHAALAAYLLAEAIDASNPSVHTNAFQCHVALSNQPAADWDYHKALAACGDKPEYAEVKSEFIEFAKKLNPSESGKRRSA